MENDYTLSLLCAIIVGHVSLNFVDSFYFEDFIQKINPNWIVPSPTTFIDKYLFQLFPMALENCDLKLKEEEVMMMLSVSNCNFQVLWQTIGLNMCP